VADSPLATTDPARSIYGDPARSYLNPSSLFVDSNYRLRFSAWCSAANVVLALRYRFLRANDNEVVDSAEQLAPTSNRVLTTAGIPLAVGWVIDLQVFALSGAPPYGTCFAKVELIRGADAVATVVATLIQGYITANQTTAYPGSSLMSSFDGAGALLSVVGTSPGAGNEISETMPAGTRREIVSFRALYTASGVAGSRFPKLTIDDGGAIPYASANPNATAITVGQLIPVVWLQGAPNVTAQTELQASLPEDNRVGAGHRLKTVTSGILGGDTWTQVQYLVREWLTAD
jgi:hypothetical protein